MKIDYLRAIEVIEGIDGSASDADFIRALGDFAQVIGCNRFAVMYLPGIMREGMKARAYHNLPGRLEDRLQSVSWDGLLQAGFVPMAIDEGEMGIGPGIACRLSHASMLAVVLMGGDGFAPTSEHLGIVAMACAPIAKALQQASLRGCPLTERELTCLTWAAAGATAKVTARHTGIPHRTVEDHLQKARTALGLPATVAAIAVAIRRGWLDLDAITQAECQLSPRSEAGQRQQR